MPLQSVFFGLLALWIGQAKALQCYNITTENNELVRHDLKDCDFENAVCVIQTKLGTDGAIKDYEHYCRPKWDLQKEDSVRVIIEVNESAYKCTQYTWCDQTEFFCSCNSDSCNGVYSPVKSLLDIMLEKETGNTSAHWIKDPMSDPIKAPFRKTAILN